MADKPKVTTRQGSVKEVGPEPIVMPNGKILKIIKIKSGKK